MRNPGASHLRPRHSILLVVALMLLIGLAEVSAPAAPRAAATTRADAVPCAAEVRACAALGARKAWLRDAAGRVVLGPVPIMPGGAGSAATPVGRFSVMRKHIDHVSSIYGTPMPFSVFFDNRGRAFHQGTLTNPSAGCVKLDRDSARRFFEGLAVGDPVEIVP